MRPKTAVILVLFLGLYSMVGLNVAAGDTPKHISSPVIETAEIPTARGTAHAVMIYRKNGKPLSMTIRADHGAIVCSHYDLGMLEKHNVAAASVQGIKSIAEALSAKVVAVNKLAEKQGVRPDMSVREALVKLMGEVR